MKIDALDARDASMNEQCPCTLTFITRRVLTVREESLHTVQPSWAKMTSVAGSEWQWRTEGGGFGAFNPPPKFRRPSKIVSYSTQFVKTVKNC